jgi:hypothetical protein
MIIMTNEIWLTISIIGGLIFAPIGFTLIDIVIGAISGAMIDMLIFGNDQSE